MKYRKKPLVIDAIQWNGKNIDEVKKFMEHTSFGYGGNQCITMRTIEGTKNAMPGDWLVKGTEGEIYPVGVNVFDKIYEKTI